MLLEIFSKEPWPVEEVSTLLQCSSDNLILSYIHTYIQGNAQFNDSYDCDASMSLSQLSSTSLSSHSFNNTDRSCEHSTTIDMDFASKDSHDHDRGKIFCQQQLFIEDISECVISVDQV